MALTCFIPGTLFARMKELNKTYENWSAIDLAQEEDFWLEIRRGYRLKPDYINLESGYYCFMPQEILEKYIEHIREVNYQNSYYLRTVQFPNKWQVQKRLAGLADCSEE
ncbi:MAG: aminotransferase, partial [Bacteroidota bacterium]